MKPRDISAFDAKTHLGQLLRDAEAGQSYTITRRGKPVARLSPIEPDKQKVDYKALAAEFGKLREKIRRRNKGLLSVRELIEEGRRH